MESIERWLPVVGYEGSYEVSNLGRVRSLDRVVEHGQAGRRYHSFRRGQVLKPALLPSGYHQVWIRNAGAADEPRRKARVHDLVARAFIGLPPRPGMEVCHNNGDPGDSRAANLRWDTSSNNKIDAVKHGTNYQTLKTHCPQRHLLLEPNLRPHNGPRPARRCLSCKKGRGDRARADRFYLSLGFGPVEQFSDRIDEGMSA